MNKAYDVAKELRYALLDEECVKEYLRLKEIFLNDEYLINLREELLKLNKDNKNKEYKELKEIYDNHPLVKNYYYCKEEVKRLINEIIEVIDI